MGNVAPSVMTPRQGWSAPPTDLALPGAEVHLWRAALDRPTPVVRRLEATLSADERSRTQRFCFEHDQRRFIVARGLLRRILGCYLNRDSSRLTFRDGPGGKPALGDTASEERLSFNLSHSHGLALYAVARGREVGVDLERVRPIVEQQHIVEGCFSPQERVMFYGLPESMQSQAFLTWWTCKEAYLKATGEGLVRPLNQIEVSLTPGTPARLLAIAGDAPAASQWWLEEVTPAFGYVGALAAQGSGGQLVCWQVPEDDGAGRWPGEG